MSDKHKIIHGACPELVKAMTDSGILPDNCCRVVIDIAFNDIVKIYYEVLGDERLLEIDFAKHILTIKQEDGPKHVRDVSDEVCPHG